MMRRASPGTIILGAGGRLTSGEGPDYLLDVWHGELDKAFMDLWDSLHVRGQDLCMLCEVD